MKRMFSLGFAAVYGIVVCVGIYAAVTLTGAGCEAVQHVANDVHDVTLGPPATPASSQPSSTQPSAHDQTIAAAHAGVQIAEVVAPSIAPIVSLVGGLAAMIGALAGGLAGSSATKTKYGGALAEVADDIATFKDPTTPWTTKTFNILTDLGKIETAVTQGGAVSINSVVGGAKV